MTDVFVSYARRDADAARAIAKYLGDRGLDVWFDARLPAHRDYTDVIEEQLDRALAVVVLWSADAVASDWVRAEANRGREAHKLLQARLDDSRLPLPFDLLQCTSLVGWDEDPDAPGVRAIYEGVEALRAGPSTRSRVVEPVEVRTRAVRVCVLPFQDHSGGQDQSHLSEGISEDLITDLSKLDALSVLARNSAFAARDRALDIADLARDHQVTHLLSGSVRRAGDRVRITAQLAEAPAGASVWAERYDREMSDIFALQDEITQDIVAALRLRLLPGEAPQRHAREDVDVQAFDLYLRGTRPALSTTEMRASAALLESATRQAPDYADAWGALAKVRAQLRLYAPWNERDALEGPVLEAADRALDRDPSNLGALEARYLLLRPFGDFRRGRRMIEALRKHGAHDTGSLFYIASHLDGVGRVAEAIEVARAAHETDPLDPTAANLHGRLLYYGGRYGAARRALNAALEQWPDNHFVVMNLINLSVHTGDWATVEALLAPERLARHPLREFERLAFGYADIMRDESDASRRRPIEAARRRFERDGSADLYQLQLAAEVGDVEEAHEIAARAIIGPRNDGRDVLGYDAYRPHFLFDSLFPRFRSDPRFVALCDRLGLVEYWVEEDLWPDCVDEVSRHYDFRAACRSLAGGTGGA